MKLKQIRETKGLSVTDLSLKSGIDAREITALEEGARSTTTKTLLELARALEVRVKDFI